MNKYRCSHTMPALFVIQTPSSNSPYVKNDLRRRQNFGMYCTVHFVFRTTLHEYVLSHSIENKTAAQPQKQKIFVLSQLERDDPFLSAHNVSFIVYRTAFLSHLEEYRIMVQLGRAFQLVMARESPEYCKRFWTRINTAAAKFINIIRLQPNFFTFFVSKR